MSIQSVLLKNLKYYKTDNGQLTISDQNFFYILLTELTKFVSFVRFKNFNF